MKKEIFITLLIILLASSCSSIQDKHQALNNYFNTIIKDTTKEIIIFKKKINSNQTIEIFGVNDIIAIDSKGSRRQDDNFYNKKDWNRMKESYSVEYLAGKNPWFTNELWTKDDFDYKKIIYEDIETGKVGAFFQKYDFKESIDVYSFSEPIFYKNNKYLIFMVSEDRTPGGFTRPYIIIMKKKNGKWIVTHKGFPDWHN